MGFNAHYFSLHNFFGIHNTRFEYFLSSINGKHSKVGMPQLFLAYVYLVVIKLRLDGDTGIIFSGVI